MSTLNVESISHPTSGSNVTINGVTPASTDSLGLRNLIINGAMQVAQRGTSATASGYGSVDRFLNDHGGGGAITQSQVALTSGSPYDEGFRYFFRQTNTTASTAAGRYMRVLQLIEAQNMSQSGWNYTSSSSYVTLSFWVRSSVAQEFYGVLNTPDGTSRNYPFSTGTLVADTWTKVTKTIPGDSNITINNDNGIGLQVEIIPFYGTNFTDSNVSVDAWANYAGGSRVPDMTSTWANTTDATFDITGVQLEVGEVATPFEHRSYGDELRRCERYYQIFTNGVNDRGIAMGAFYNSSTCVCVLPFRTTMRANPTIDATNGGSPSPFTFYIHGIGHNTATVTAGGGTTPYAAGIRPSSAVSGTQGSAGEFKTSNAAAHLGFSAEL